MEGDVRVGCPSLYPASAVTLVVKPAPDLNPHLEREYQCQLSSEWVKRGT